MDDEQLMILRMVQNGTITPEQADILLSALPSSRPDTAAPMTSPVTSSVAPDMQRFRRSWEIPFSVGLLLLGAAGLCVVYANNTLLLVCGGLVIPLAGGVTVVGWLSQYAPWVHVRFRDEDGRRFAFSLPLPLQIAGPVLGLVRPLFYRFADDRTCLGFDTATAFVSALDDSALNEPVMVEFDDGDSDHVQIFLG